MTRTRRIAAAVLLALSVATVSGVSVRAVQPDEMLADPALEARARALSGELRCLVCQNQSIDDSDAPLAKDLRILVRERIKSGDSNTQVMDYLVARYGEFVLLRPRFEWHTAILWLMPFAVLGFGALAIVAGIRRRATAKGSAEVPLTADEKARLESILSRDA